MPGPRPRRKLAGFAMPCVRGRDSTAASDQRLTVVAPASATAGAATDGDWGGDVRRREFAGTGRVGTLGAVLAEPSRAELEEGQGANRLGEERRGEAGRQARGGEGGAVPEGRGQQGRGRHRCTVRDVCQLTAAGRSAASLLLDAVVQGTDVLHRHGARAAWPRNVIHWE